MQAGIAVAIDLIEQRIAALQDIRNQPVPAGPLAVSHYP
jgi:hypothetical protein